MCRCGGRASYFVSIMAVRLPCVRLVASLLPPSSFASGISSQIPHTPTVPHPQTSRSLAVLVPPWLWDIHIIFVDKEASLRRYAPIFFGNARVQRFPHNDQRDSVRMLDAVARGAALAIHAISVRG